MQFLGGAPRPPVAIFTQMFDHEPDVRPGADARLGMPEPKAFRVSLDEGEGPFNQLWRRGRCG